jgi:type IV pilus assembly protein PilV
MKRPMRLPNARRQAGATLIEILVSLVILMVGLLGLVGVMIQSQRAQLESYQRVQALMLVQEMAARMSANKVVASCYVLAAPIGTGNTTTPAASSCVSATATASEKAQFAQDLVDWKDLLIGSSETDASGATNIGAVLGARGCIESAGTDTYLITVAWQGSVATTAPPAGLTCGTGQYGSDDSLRRAVGITVQLVVL